MTRERRLSGWYPTDPYAAEALRVWLARYAFQALKTGVWRDPCAGYGGLLQGLKIPIENRRAIELHKRHEPELKRRVPHYRIGDGLSLPWAPGEHIAMNPDFDNDVMGAFVSRALEHQERTKGLVCCLALATWWHSDVFRSKGKALRKPTHILVPSQRVSCDGTGRGDMRAIDWLIWHPALGGSTVVEWLPPAAPDALLLSDHRRLAGA